MLDDFIKEMGGDRDSGTDGEEAAGEDGTETINVAVERTGGRVIYRPGETVGIYTLLSCALQLNVPLYAVQHLITQDQGYSTFRNHQCDIGSKFVTPVTCPRFSCTRTPLQTCGNRVQPLACTEGLDGQSPSKEE
jgi:hypothetical protein